MALALMTMVDTVSAQGDAGGTVGAGNVDTDRRGSGGGTGFTGMAQVEAHGGDGRHHL